MKRIGISLLLLCGLCLNDCNAQQNLDSLWTVWEDETQKDSLRLAALREFIWTGYLFSDLDSAFHFAEIQYAFAEEKKQDWGRADALLNQGVTFLLKGDAESALVFFEKGLEISEACKAIPTQLEALVNIGVTHANLGDIAKAISTNDLGLEIAKRHGDFLRQMKFLGNNGTQYGSLGNYPKALDHYLEGLKIAIQLNEPQIGVMYTNIGVIYEIQGDKTKALDYYEQGLKHAEKTENHVLMPSAISAIGRIHLGMGDTTKAMGLFARGLDISVKLGDKNRESLALYDLGILYQGAGNFSKALDHYMQCLRLREETGDQIGLAEMHVRIGELYRDRGEFAKAVEYCQKGYELAFSIGASYQGKDACQCLYDTYKGQGNSTKALEYYEQMVALKDSIFNEANTKKLTQLEMQYDFDKKEAATQAEQEKKDAVAAQELERQTMARNGFMGGFAVVLLFAGVFFVQRNRIGKEKQRSEELLLNILPEEVAEELKEKGHSDAQLIDQVTVLFTDFKGFTALSEKVTPKELVKDLHECFSQFDNICEKYGIEKIKTIGDAYMAAGGLPSPNITHAQDVVKAALEMAEVVEQGKANKIAAGLPFFEIRVGVHTGPVVAGIVGVKKFQYDIWGDTVNTASRMESSGEVGMVNISHTTYELVKDQFTCEYRGEVEAKDKGKLKMYFVKEKYIDAN
jgi:class 3 adenylate cyclase/tetratricopeptide (TPR) repeat protein